MANHIGSFATSTNQVKENESDKEIFDQENGHTKKLYLTDENREKAAKDENFRCVLARNFTCFTCKLCDQLFFTKELLKKHAENEHFISSGNFDLLQLNKYETAPYFFN